MAADFDGVHVVAPTLIIVVVIQMELPQSRGSVDHLGEMELAGAPLLPSRFD